MAHVPIEFDWWRDPKGYRLEETGSPKMLCVVRNGTGHGPGDLLLLRPLNTTDVLFKIFAKTATTPEGVLNFVQRFGPLTWDGWGETGGEPVSYAISDADHMRRVLNYWASNHAHPKQPSLPQAGRLVSLKAMVVGDQINKSPRWEFRPETLLDALWLQLGQALTAGGQISVCEHCGDWFEAGQGTGRRLDAKFCRDEHRVAFNSFKRSREK
jgi:hypothetical protein